MDGTTILVDVEENNTVSSRSGELIIYDETYDGTLKAVFVQEPNPSASSFKVEPISISYQATGGYQYLNIIGE